MRVATVGAHAQWNRIPKFLTNAMNSDVSIKEIEHIRAICE